MKLLLKNTYIMSITIKNPFVIRYNAIVQELSTCLMADSDQSITDSNDLAYNIDKIFTPSIILIPKITKERLDKYLYIINNLYLLLDEISNVSSKIVQNIYLIIGSLLLNCIINRSLTNPHYMGLAVYYLTYHNTNYGKYIISLHT